MKRKWPAALVALLITVILLAVVTNRASAVSNVVTLSAQSCNNGFTYANWIYGDVYGLAANESIDGVDFNFNGTYQTASVYGTQAETDPNASTGVWGYVTTGSAPATPWKIRVWIQPSGGTRYSYEASNSVYPSCP